MKLTQALMFDFIVANRISLVLNHCPVTVDKLPLAVEAFSRADYEKGYLDDIVNRGMGELWELSSDGKLHALC